MGNFGLIVVQIYASLYLRICAKHFSQALQHGRAEQLGKSH